MRTWSGAATRAAMALLALGLGACGDRAPDEQVGGPEGEAYEGLSRDQIESQAQPMSPEQAAERGIVDTIIHLEKLTSPADSALLGDTIRLAPGDTS